MLLAAEHKTISRRGPAPLTLYWCCPKAGWRHPGGFPLPRWPFVLLVSPRGLRHASPLKTEQRQRAPCRLLGIQVMTQIRAILMEITMTLSLANVRTRANRFASTRSCHYVEWKAANGHWLFVANQKHWWKGNGGGRVGPKGITSSLNFAACVVLHIWYSILEWWNKRIDALTIFYTHTKKKTRFSLSTLGANNPERSFSNPISGKWIQGNYLFEAYYGVIFSLHDTES